MANIQKRVLKNKISWRARYRTPSGAERSKSFDRKTEAERFLTTVESSRILGSYVDPTTSRLAVGEWAELWLTYQTHLKPSTHERYAGILRRHVLPRWKFIELGKLTHCEVQSWVRTLSLRHSPATVRKVHSVPVLILDMAVKDGRLAKNVARGVNLPRIVTEERRYLTHVQVEALATQCGRPSVVSKHRRLSERRNETYRLIVLFLAYTGVRFGELAALCVDPTRRRARIVASVTVVQGRGLVWGRRRPTSAAKSPSRPSSPLSSPSMWSAAPPTVWCSRAFVAGDLCEPRSSGVEDSMGPRPPSACPDCIPTSFATQRPASPSRRAPTSRSSNGCLATHRHRRRWTSTEISSTTGSMKSQKPWTRHARHHSPQSPNRPRRHRT